MGVLQKLHRAMVTLDLAERGKMAPVAAIVLAKELIADAMGITYGVLDDLEGEGGPDGDEEAEEQFLGIGAAWPPQVS